MTIRISPASEQDIPALVRIELEAFRNHPRQPMLWPNGYTKDLYEWFESKKIKTFQDPNATLLKAVTDNGRGTIVGASEITFNLNPLQNSSQHGTCPDEPRPINWPVGGNWEMHSFFALNAETLATQTFAGKPYIVIEILAVDPAHQREGIGAELLNWTVTEADKHNVPLGLESTPAGLTLYTRWGFVAQVTTKADMRAFGWNREYEEESVKRVWMVREPRVSGGRTFAARGGH